MLWQFTFSLGEANGSRLPFLLVDEFDRLVSFFPLICRFLGLHPMRDHNNSPRFNWLVAGAFGIKKPSNFCSAERQSVRFLKTETESALGRLLQDFQPMVLSIFSRDSVGLFARH